jgi:hypothetical protein
MRMTCSSVGNEDLAVADLAGLGRLGDGLDGLIQLRRYLIDGDLDLDLGQKVDDVFGAAVELRVALLTAEALDLVTVMPGHADVREGLAHVVELERLDDG